MPESLPSRASDNFSVYFLTTFLFQGVPSLHECLPCPAGSSCMAAGLTEPSGGCHPGYFCPTGTVHPTDYACPAGTYTDSDNLTAISGCTVCPPGHFCIQGSGGPSAPPQTCFLGHYCPAGSTRGNQYPCPPGTFGPTNNLTDYSECTPCPAGSHCVGGSGVISGPCTQGHYCPEFTVRGTDFPCDPGTYSSLTNLTDQSECTDCPPGKYCPIATVVPILCPAGSFTGVDRTQSAGPGTFPSCQVCPSGYFCTPGSIEPQPCGAGYTSAPNSSACSPCPSGYFCDLEVTDTTTLYSAKQCPAGLYCPLGLATPPNNVSQPCPVGQFCPVATSEPINCAPGSYNPFVGQAVCQPCPPGSFCIEAAVNVTGVCDRGYYCPQSSTSSQQTPCPGGYALQTTGGQSVSDCALCDAGTYCPVGTGLPMDCPRGM